MKAVQTLNHFSRIYLVSDLTTSAQKFLNTLKLQWATPTIFSTYDRSLQFQEEDLIIISTVSADINDTHKILDHLEVYLENPQIVLFTESKQPKISSLIQRFLVKGVITDEMSDDLIEQGLKKLDSGSFWFSRDQYEIIAEMRKGSNLTSIATQFELTSREKQILFLLTNGYSIQQMAERLFVAKSTIKTHRNRLYKKLGVSSSLEAIHFLHKQNH